MLNESLKRRWQEPGFTYEPPEKVRLLSTRGGKNREISEPLSELNNISIICQDQPARTDCVLDLRHKVNRQYPTQSQNGVVPRKGKRRLAGCEDCQSIPPADNSTQHPPKRLKTTPREASGPTKKKMDSEFSEFNFWKPVLPDIELELPDFLSADNSIMDTSDAEMVSSSVEENPQYNAFNFWKVPVADLEIDLNTL